MTVNGPAPDMIEGSHGQSTSSLLPVLRTRRKAFTRNGGERARSRASADVKREPQLPSREAARAANYKRDQTAPGARIDDFVEYDAVVVGTGARFGRTSSQMASFLDQAGGVWTKRALQGKVGAALAPSATQHGGHIITTYSTSARQGRTELRICRADEH